jgi:hypothetical protein
MKRAENVITAIAVRGYKSICNELRMELKPLTILAGANSSGKSSIMQPILLLKQTLENPFDPGVFRLSGPNVRFTSAGQLLWKVPGKAEGDSFKIAFEKGPKAMVALTYKKVEGKGFDIESLEYSNGQGKGRITEQLTHEEILQMVPEPLRKFSQDFQRDAGKPEWQWVAYRERCFLGFSLTRKGAPGERVTFGPTELSPAGMISPEIEGIIHVPGLRGNPERTYTKTTSVGPNFPGTFENYVASVVSQWQTSDKERLAQLGQWLKQLGLTWKVDAKSVDDTRVELRVGRLLHSRRGGAQDMVNMADVGFGLSQILPVVVALLAARPGQLVYLEQPEIHLHPLAQRRLAGLLASAAKERGIRVVVETHSALLLREMQTLVATAKLPGDLVKLHWFKRNADDGITQLFTADLDKNGAYGDWPEDFGEIQLASEKDYLDAVEKESGQA